MIRKRKSMVLFLAILFIAACLCVGCENSENGTPADRKKPAPANSVDSRLVAANMRFGFNIFQEIHKQNPGQNIFISPASVAIALAMTYNGAGGETQQAMSGTLGLQGLSLEEVNRANAALKTILENPDPKLELTVANSLWAREGITFKPEFIQRNRDYYKAEVVDLDFGNPGAPAAINAWVSRKTNGKIDKIVKSTDHDDILFLINTIYFKGSWAEKFGKEKTKEGLFTLLDGTQKKHPMMFQSGDYKYYQGNKFQAVSLPYGNERVSMYVFLPDKNSSLEEFYKSLNAENWEKWTSRFNKMQGNVVLPRFKFEYEVELKDTLKALGMGVAFDREGADFGNMCPIPPNVFIDKVKHKTFVEVNEEGTEAAAVTSVKVKCEGIPEVFNMVIDRPFFFAISDDKTGTILFMGSVMEPE